MTSQVECCPKCNSELKESHSFKTLNVYLTCLKCGYDKKIGHRPISNDEARLLVRSLN